MVHGGDGADDPPFTASYRLLTMRTARSAFGRDLSPMFHTLPIRRLGLHRGPGDHLLKVVFVALPELTAEVVDQRYRAVSPLEEGARPGEAVVGFTWNTVAAELVVDADAVVTSSPGVASRFPAETATASP